MATREEIGLEEAADGRYDEDLDGFDSAQTAIPNPQASSDSARRMTEPHAGEIPGVIWEEERQDDLELLEAEGEQEEEVERLRCLRPTDPKENASLEECMALVTAVKSRNPFGAPQGKRGAYWEDVLKDLQAEGFFKDKKTPFLKTRTAELLHLHQNAEYLNEENPEKDSEPGGQIRARGRGQISSQNQSRHQQVGFRRLANKKNFSLTENSMSFLAGSLDAISYMKETAESDRSTRTAAKRKAADTEHAQGAALREISLRGWVRRREMERILAEASDNGMNQEESGGRIALSSRRVNDWRARKRLSRTVSGEGILSPSDYEEPWSSQESQSLAPRTDASSLLSSTPLRQAVSSPITGSSNIQESHLPSTPVSNLRHSRRQLTPAELSHVFLHSTSSRAERQQESWDEILQCLRSQVTVEKEMIGLLREIKEEILNLRGRMRGHESAGLAD